MMIRSAIRLAAACGSVLLLACATLPASAAYLGYGNGDPGNYDLWTEQNGGHSPGMIAPKYSAPGHHAKPVHHTAHHHQYKSAKESKAS